MLTGQVLPICAAVLALNAPAPGGERPARAPAGFRVVGYLPDYRAREFDARAAAALTDLVLFSAEPTAAGGLDLGRLKEVPWARLRAFKTRQRVRLILCVGGGGRSAHFAAVSGTADGRREFARAALRLCLEQRLDGIDLDWEHPQGAAQEGAYGKLLAELSGAFAPHGLVLTVTVAAWQKLTPEALAAVDWVHVMAYDHPGRHSTLEGARRDVQALRQAGAPAAKIVLGVPFYGRGIKKPAEALSYRDIVAQWDPPPEADEAGGLYFNGPATVRRKTEFALRAGLAGVMVWELGQDAPGPRSLLGAIREVVDRPGTR
jgi:GH18 family chitinase